MVASASPTSRQTLKALLEDALAAPSSALGYAVTDISFGEAVEITLEKGASTLVLWLRPVSDETAHYKKTARFKIGHAGDSPDQLGRALMDAACAQIAAWEGSLPDDACTHLFEPRPVAEPEPPPPASAENAAAPGLRLEWRAVLCGLKPACRNLVPSDEAVELVERASANGLHACTTPAGTFVARFCSQTVTEGTTTLVHVARTEEEAAAAAAAERAMIEADGRGERVTPEQTQRLGAALGYPPCCIEAFIPVQNRSAAEIRFRAVMRTPGAPSLLLNNIVEGRALVSHYVCRYDCPASIRYAEALLQALRRNEPTAADELVCSLAGLVIFFDHDGALRLLAATNAAADTYRYAGVEVAGAGAQIERWGELLSAADGLQVQAQQVRIVRGAEEIARLHAPPGEVQIHLFT